MSVFIANAETFLSVFILASDDNDDGKSCLRGLSCDGIKGLQATFFCCSVMGF